MARLSLAKKKESPVDASPLTQPLVYIRLNYQGTLLTGLCAPVVPQPQR